MTRKIICMVAVLSLLGGVTVFAAGGEAREEAKVPVKVKYLIPGSARGPEEPVVLDALNKKMQADGLNLEFEIVAIPWDVWQQKTSLMMSTGEEFDMLHIMEDISGFARYVSQGALIPIDEYLDEYGPALKKNIPDVMWNSTKVKGKGYVIPSFWAETCSSVDCFIMRLDWLKQNNLAIPRTPEELLNASETIQKNWKGEGEKPYIPIRTKADTWWFLHRAYDSFPFYVFQKLIYVDQKGNVKSWIETEEFKKDCNFFGEAYDRGLIHPDVLGQPSQWIWDRIREGKLLFRPGCPLDLFGDMQKNNPGMEVGDVDNVTFGADKPIFRYYGVKNSNGISVTSKHPEAVVQFLNWVYSSQENFDLLLYGIEGKHWIDRGKQKVEKVLGEDGRPLYGMAEWMIGNVKYVRYDQLTHPSRIEVMSNVRKDAVNSATIGFVFDPSSVDSEYANCFNELQVSILPMRMGLVSYEDGYSNALSKMKAAGIDKVVAEYAKQFKAWLASK